MNPVIQLDLRIHVLGTGKRNWDNLSVFNEHSGDFRFKELFSENANGLGKMRMAWENGSVRHGYSKSSIRSFFETNFMPTLRFRHLRRIMPRISRTLSTMLALFWFAQCIHSQPADRRPAAADARQRVIILTDIGAEADDTESMVRLLLYSGVIDIQGLVATTSTWKRTSVSPELIQAVIRAYAKVGENLVKHDPNYPPAETLHSLVKRAGWDTE